MQRAAAPLPPQQHLRFASLFGKITPAVRPLLILLFLGNVKAVLFHPEGSIISGGGFDPGISGVAGSGTARIISPFVITSAGGGDSETGRMMSVTMTLKRVWSSLLMLAFVGGSGGSVPALLGALSMIFQATNSMSVPSAGRDPPKLRSLFKQRYQIESDIPPGVDLSEKEDKGKSKSYHNGARAQPRSIGNFFQALFGDYDKADSEDEHKKSRDDNLSLSQIIPSNPDDINSSDYSPGLNSILQSLYPSLEEMQDSSAFQRRHKRNKPNKLGKNANELQSLFSIEGSSESRGNGEGAGGTMRNNLYMNNKKEEALRREVLDRVEELDPLMCLPKVLCGYSSRQSLKNRYSRPKPGTSTVKPPTGFGEGYLDDYLELLKIVRPDSVLKEKPSKKSKKKAKKKISTKKAGKRKKKKSEWYLNPEEHEVNDILQDGSASSESIESEEDPFPPSIHYPHYPIGSKKYQKKYRKFFKKKKGKDDDDDDDDDGDVEEEFQLEDDILPESYLSDEDMAYLKKKAQMNKMMDVSLAHSNENWWVPFEQSYEFYKYPHLMTDGPPEPIFDPLENTSSGGGMINWMTNMVSNLMPSMSFGGGNDEFKNDPFFSFDGRGLRKNGHNLRWAWGRSSFRDNPGNSTSPSSNSTSIPRIQLRKEQASKMSRSGRMLGDELMKLLGTEMDSRQLDSGMVMEAGRDPAAKFRSAVQIGRRVTDPSQCDFIYNGCPLSYEEILTVINEPMRQPPAQTFQTTAKPRPTASFQYRPSQNTLTIAPPQVISLPYYGPSGPHQVFPYQSHYQFSPQHYHNQAHHHQMFQQQPQYQQQYLHQQQNNFHKSHQRPNSHHLQYQNQDGYGYGQQNKLDELISQLETDEDEVKPTMAIGSGFLKPHHHKTSIHQALPSGEEVHINLLYSDNAKQPNSHELDRTGITATSSQEASDVAQEEIHSSATAAAAAAAASAVLDLDQNQPTTFNQSALGSGSPLPSPISYVLNSSSPSGYKIQRTKDKDKQAGVKLAEIANSQVVKINASSSGSSSMEDTSDSLKSNQSSSGPLKIYSLEMSPELRDPVPKTSHKKVPKIRPSVPTFPKKVRKKSKDKLKKYEEMLKDAFSLSESASPKRPSATKILSSLTKSISKMKMAKRKKEKVRTSTPTPRASEYKIRKKTLPPKKKMKTSSKKRKKDSQQSNDKDEDGGNSSTGANGGSISDDPDASINVSSSNSEELPKKKGKLKKSNTIRLSLNKRRKKHRHQHHHHHPLHLHKQSSQRIPGKRGVKRKIPPPAHTSSIYPVYGYPFPEPYGGSHYYQYHHPPYPPPRPTHPTLASPTSGSLFSYFFGR